mmetsp:Transcript_44537/g.115806  ORF Transcript_44537/g.115806 Transcript_44537/m.115806 type:complete len:265 (+) Transcript_44537:527-1321(+)
MDSVRVVLVEEPREPRHRGATTAGKVHPGLGAPAHLCRQGAPSALAEATAPEGGHAEMPGGFRADLRGAGSRHAAHFGSRARPRRQAASPCGAHALAAGPTCWGKLPGGPVADAGGRLPCAETAARLDNAEDAGNAQRVGLQGPFVGRVRLQAAGHVHRGRGCRQGEARGGAGETRRLSEQGRGDRGGAAGGLRGREGLPAILEGIAGDYRAFPGQRRSLHGPHPAVRASFPKSEEDLSGAGQPGLMALSHRALFLLPHCHPSF